MNTLLSILLLAPSAHAFCGTYVGPLGSTVTNRGGQVLISRYGDSTTLTLAPDYEGNTTSFAMVIPVPEVLGEEDVSVQSWELFAALDSFSAPRVVSYTCEDLYWGGSSYSDAGGSDGSYGGETADGVTVEAEFSEGVYDIVILSATGAEGLEAWLEANEMPLPEGSTALVQEYIDAGNYFLGAKVDLSELPDGPAMLEPLQLRYDSGPWSLPIRLGTTVSTGSQEMVIFTLTPNEDGATGIANYTEATLESDCMLPEETSSVVDFYSARLDEAFDKGQWVREYSWSPQWCDPCSSELPTAEQLTAAGADPDDAWLTRLRVRYSPEQATQDLVLYSTGMNETDQIKYITWKHELESDFETCGVGIPDDPGSCDQGDDGGGDGGGDMGSGDGSSGELSGGGGCSTAGRSASLAGGLLALAALGLRRRRV